MFGRDFAFAFAFRFNVDQPFLHNDPYQEGVSVLAHAARRSDFSMFEYLMERGVDLPSDMDMDMEESEDQAMIAAMLQRRQEWIDQAISLAGRWHLPLIAVRTIHEYVVGFNWAVVSRAFNSPTKFCVVPHVVVAQPQQEPDPAQPLPLLPRQNYVSSKRACVVM